MKFEKKIKDSKDVDSTDDVGFKKLTEEEEDQKKKNEEEIERHSENPFKIGEALFLIKDLKLYRDTHKTFADYSRERWDISRTYAYKFIDASKLRSHLKGQCVQIEDINILTNVAQARELTELFNRKNKSTLNAVWKDVVEEYHKNNKKRITAEEIRIIVELHKGKRNVNSSKGNKESKKNSTAKIKMNNFFKGIKSTYQAKINESTQLRIEKIKKEIEDLIDELENQEDSQAKQVDVP